MLISFIIPVYNSEKTLAMCLDSILCQDIQDVEIILIDDGSLDDSKKIIQTYLDKYPYCVKAFYKSNMGPGKARNVGIDHAQGVYIAFVDSDDAITPNYLSNIRPTLQLLNPDMLLIGYNRNYIRKQNLFERLYAFNFWNTYSTTFNMESSPDLICRIEVAVWLKIVKRKIIQNDPDLYFSERLIGEDLEICLKWYPHMKKIIAIEDKLYNYYVKGNTLHTSSKYALQYIDIMQDVIRYYKKLGIFEQVEVELEYMFAKHLLISNLLRLMGSKNENAFQIMSDLRGELMRNFPKFGLNSYFKLEPLYIRMVIKLLYYIPNVFRYLI